MARLTIKRTTTIKRTVSVRQQVRTSIRTSIPTTSVLPSITPFIPTTSNVITPPSVSSISYTPPRLPKGIYSPQVESYYEQLAKQTEHKSDDVLYDVFISHASEDKKDFVIPLVNALQDVGIRVWYDSLDMEWGKSLRTQIDNGIRKSNYAILVLSKHFFSKKWPLRELDGILAKEEVTGTAPLPIWYNVTKEEVYEFSPSLAGIFSMSSSEHSIEDICQAFSLILEKEKIRN